MSDDIEDLFDAIYRGDEEECTRLVRAGADLRARLESSDPDRWSVLHAAADRFRLDIARILLDAGADPRSKDRLGNTPLHVAAAKNDRYLRDEAVECVVEIVKLLIERGADPNAPNDEGETPLLVAAARGRSAVCAALIKARADVRSTDAVGNTPLLRAAAYGMTENCGVLLSEGGDPDVRNEKGDTPLHEAAHCGHAEILSMLVKAGADIEARNGAGDTPLIRAAQTGNVEEAIILVEAGADHRARGAENLDPLVLAMEEGSGRGRRGLLPFFLDKGLADVRATNLDGDTLLILALMTEDPAIIRRLLDAGADTNARNIRGDSPLHCAAWQAGESSGDACRTICELLLAAGADPAARNEKGLLPEEETDDEDIRDRLRAAREARELGAEARPVEELKPSRRGRLGRKPAEDRTDEA